MKNKIACLIVLIVGALAPAIAVAHQDPATAFKVKIGVTDFEKAVAFYQNFDLKKGTLYNPRELGLDWTRKNLEGITNVILVTPDIVTPGYGFILIYVPDLPAIRKQLVDQGYTNIKDFSNGWLMLVKDPDGNTVEVIQHPKPTPQ